MCPLSPLKINKDSHFIKKSPTTSSTLSSTIANRTVPITKPQHRHPVIIYTHSPKVIHTHPRDFMALVQKLTGLSKSKEDQLATETPKGEPGNRKKGGHNYTNTNSRKGIMINDDNESTSVITDENGSNSMGDGQVNSCFVPPIFDPPANPGFKIIPLFTPGSYDFLCAKSTQTYYSYHDPMFYMPTMRNSISSPSTLDGLEEFPDFQ